MLGFHYPSGPLWRVLEPLAALVWVVGFVALMPVGFAVARSWRSREIRRGALFAAGLTLPSVMMAAEYVGRVIARAPADELTTFPAAMLASLAGVLLLWRSYRATSVERSPVSFEVVRTLCIAGWATGFAFCCLIGMSV